MKSKIIEVAGKKYTLVANRNIIKTISDICPEILNLSSAGNAKEIEKSISVTLGIKIMSNLDVLFHDMLKIVHKEISKEKSDEILELFESEYNGVQENLIKFALSVFTEGNPKQSKKNLNWLNPEKMMVKQVYPNSKTCLTIFNFTCCHLP